MVRGLQSPKLVKVSTPKVNSQKLQTGLFCILKNIVAVPSCGKTQYIEIVSSLPWNMCVVEVVFISTQFCPKILDLIAMKISELQFSVYFV